MSSKRDKVDSFIRRAVRSSLQELAFEQPGHSEVLRHLANTLEIYVASNITSDAYRMRELQDIMDWKQPPKGK